MATVSAFLGASSAPITLDIVGVDGQPRTLTLKPLTWGMISELERWLVMRDARMLADVLSAMKSAGVLTESYVAERVATFMRDATDEGKYSFGGEKMQALFGGDSTDQGGQLKFLSLLLGAKEDDVLTAMAQKGEELILKVKLIVGESLPTPKTKEPTTTA